MKANKSFANPEVELTGKVVRKKFGPGSKSEHQAIFFETDNGTYQLRRTGENAFSDPGLKKLIGKQVNATGRINASLFLASKVEKVEEGK